MLLAAALLGPASREPGAGVGAPAPGPEAVTVDGVRLSLPPPGQAVWAEVLLATGATQLVGVEVRRDGSLLVHRSGLHAPHALLAMEDPCRDRAFVVEHGPWRRTFSWAFRDRGLPPGASAGAVEQALLRAVANLVDGRNDCGLTARLRVPVQYRGRTSSAPGVGPAGCGRRDGQSVVGFGPLARGYVAWTCWWVGRRGPAEADLLLSDAPVWAVRIPRPCTERWSLEAVATHEFGHVLGLGHVEEAGHAALTMSPVIRPCQAAEATLGLGDLLGLDRLY
jgi:hypothetical protein